MIDTFFNKSSESGDTDVAQWCLVVNSPGRNSRTIALPNKGEMSIGQSISNDIVLRDASDIQLALHLNYPAMQIEVKSGYVDIDEQRYEAGQRMNFDTQIATFYDIAICVKESSALSAASLSEVDSGKDSAIDLDSESDPYTSLAGNSTRRSTSNSANSSANTSANSSANYIWLSVALLLLAIGVWKMFQSKGTTGIDSEEVTRLFLQDKQYTSITSTKDGDQITINGRVSRQEQLIDIDRFVSDHQTISRGNIVVEELVENAVYDVFRINGIEADIGFNSNDVIVVTTAVTEESLEKVKNIIATDLPLLKSLEYVNTPPPIPKEKTAPVKVDAGKRVAMVVSGDPAYVLTQDSTRYFVGSILPSGHRVLRIEDGRVTLALNGVESKLQF